MRPRVTVAGGGYGGIAIARALDDVALRGLVDPAWAERLFLPYDRLLAAGTVLRDRVAEAGGNPRRPADVRLASGRTLAADALVLATGSTYPFPAKFAEPDRADVVARLDRAREVLAPARRVLLLGAGPVGLELAGEIVARWPDKLVTVVDPHDDLLPGPLPDAFRASLRDQLLALGVTLRLGTTAAAPSTEPGTAGTFTVAVSAGEPLTADVWFRCHGLAPAGEYLAGDLLAARTPSGHLRVDGRLRVAGVPGVFAIGDLTDVRETKTAKAAGLHADHVAATIRAGLTGGEAPAPYVPGPPGFSIPLGPDGGASYSPAAGLLDAATTARLKGADLRLDRYRELLGLDPARREPAA